MTKNEFLNLRTEGFTFTEIGSLFGLTERQVNYRTRAWGLDFSKKKSINDNFFSNKTKEVFYWAGFLAADGYIEGDRNRVGLALQSQDIGHLEKFKKAIESDHDICPFMSDAAYRIRFNSPQMVLDLCNNFNIIPRKTHYYTMPAFEEEYLMLEFFRGYIEGDGHIEVTASRKPKLHICSAKKDFLEEFKELLSISLNRPIYQKVNLKVNKKGSVYALVFTIQDSIDILYLLYKNSTEKTRLDRKFTTYMSVTQK